MFAVKQHQRRKERKFNIAWLVNLIMFKGYHDYCLEVWVAWTLENKKNEN